MAAKKVRQTKKQPTAEAPIRKSLNKAKAKAIPQPVPAPVGPPMQRKQMTSGFLSYISSAMHSKSG